MVDLVLEVIRLECHGGEDCGLLPWGVDAVGYKRRGDGPNSLRSGAAFRGKGITGAGRRLGCYGDKLGHVEIRTEGIVDSRRSESSGDEQRQRWDYAVREHGSDFSACFGACFDVGDVSG